MTDNCSALLRHDKIIRSLIAPDLTRHHQGLPDGVVVGSLTAWSLVMSSSGSVLAPAQHANWPGRDLRPGNSWEKLNNMIRYDMIMLKLSANTQYKCKHRIDSPQIQFDFIDWELHDCSPLYFFHFRNCSFHSLIDFYWNEKKRKRLNYHFASLHFFVIFIDLTCI